MHLVPRIVTRSEKNHLSKVVNPSAGCEMLTTVNSKWFSDKKVTYVFFIKYCSCSIFCKGYEEMHTHTHSGILNIDQTPQKTLVSMLSYIHLFLALHLLFSSRNWIIIWFLVKWCLARLVKSAQFSFLTILWTQLRGNNWSFFPV